MKAFKYFDLNGNGTVEQTEMQARLGGQRMIKFLDKNKDGMISRKELDASNEQQDDKAKSKEPN